jgi:predicted nucleic acid-binding protein
MLYLVDTNILLRRARLSDPLNIIARVAIETLIRSESTLHITSQNIIEFWNVLTRPTEKNGFGLSPAQAEKEANQLESFFSFLPDDAHIYKRWRQIVTSHNVSGVQVHDARLVAVMLTYGITHIISFNFRDFQRYSPIVTAVDPRYV